MSDESDKPRKRVRTGGGSGTGRSGSARSIGEELGGLDFEPDALLDSLMSDDDAPPPIIRLWLPPGEPRIEEAAEAPRRDGPAARARHRPYRPKRSRLSAR
jgi:hypothetical protein